MAEKCRRAVGGASKEYDEEFLQHFCDAMNDDFDTPLALRALSEGLASTSNTRSATAAARKLASIRWQPAYWVSILGLASSKDLELNEAVGGPTGRTCSGPGKIICHGLPDFDEYFFNRAGFVDCSSGLDTLWR